MFHSITFNGTDKKQIGAPIIRKTNEMINEFDLQYERNYKIVKIISQRELEFQEFLKQQEALQFRLDHLIKICRKYFKENNYNSNTYYNLFRKTNNNISRKRRKKRRKRMRPKTTEIKRNKYIFYKITKNNFYYNRFKPYLLPLTNKDKRHFARKIFTDPNLKEKEKNSLSNMTPAQLKKFVDVFGFIPATFKKEDEEEKKKNHKTKFKKNKNFSYNYLKDKNFRVLRSKNLPNISAKKGLNNKINNINNSNSYRNFLRNIIDDFNVNKYNSTNNLSLTSNKFFKYNVFNNNNKLSHKTINNFNNNNIFYNNRYLNLKNSNNNNQRMNSNSINNYNYYLSNNFHSLSSINSPKISIFNSKSYKNSKNSFSNEKNKNTNQEEKVIKIKKNINIENLKKKSFTSQCINAIQKSEVLTKDIEYLSKAYNISGENFNNKKNKIENKTLQRIDFISMLEIYKKDFKPDMKKKLESKYEHIKEDSKGRIKVKKVEFIRKPKSKLNFVRDYNKRRELKLLNRVDFLYNNKDEVKSDLTTFKVKRSFSRIKLNGNSFKKFKYTSSVK